MAHFFEYPKTFRVKMQMNFSCDVLQPWVIIFEKISNNKLNSSSLSIKVSLCFLLRSTGPWLITTGSIDIVDNRCYKTLLTVLYN